jgi:hypothetical protein
MAQDWTNNTYAPSNVGQTDLQNIENNFLTLRSSFSGGVAPTSPVAGNIWFDTSKEVLKFRDAQNSTWYGMFHGDVDQKILVYRNSAMDGYAIDSSVTDKVVATKGGSTYVTAGISSQGTWTMPNHTLTIAEIPSHRHAGDGGSRFMSNTGNTHGSGGDNYGLFTYTDYVGGGGPHNHGTSWRPAAAVCTLQYLDI